MGDSVVLSSQSSVLNEICGKILSVEDGDVLKIDQSVVCDENFADANLCIDLLHDGLKIIENFYNLDELLFIDEFKTFDYYEIDFSGYELEISNLKC
ncbi:MAG: hypothetical protein ACTTJC_03540 [Campylobacter sp.]